MAVTDMADCQSGVGSEWLAACWSGVDSEKKVDMLVSAFMMGFLNMVFAKDEPMLLDYETANMCIINQSLFI